MTVQTLEKVKINYKDETKRSRGKFKPALNLSVDEVKSVLMKKIDEETSKIIEDEQDFELIKNIKHKKIKSIWFLCFQVLVVLTLEQN
ncbi:hypothetical protein ABG808_00095 [Streptococcus iniae]